MTLSINEARTAFPWHITGVLAVVAHPDDESFGLGAVLAKLINHGVRSSVICFTHGEASTLHGTPGELSIIRSQELHEASDALGLARVELHDYPDGHLADISLEELANHVLRLIEDEHPSHLLAFDLGGVTGHPDHHRATQAAIAAARAASLPVLTWTLPQSVAQQLNAELGTAFVGHEPAELDLSFPVNRQIQSQAIACHRSQSADNPVLRRRLDLLGNREYLRLIRPWSLPSEITPMAATVPASL